MNSVTMVRKLSRNRSPTLKPAPEAAEPLVDELGVADAGHRPEPYHHLLVDDQHRHEQQQHPQQGVAVVLPGLRVGGDAAGVVVADHHDQAGADDGKERHQPPPEAVPVVVLADPDPAERAFDVTEMLLRRGRRSGRSGSLGAGRRLARGWLAGSGGPARWRGRAASWPLRLGRVTARGAGAAWRWPLMGRLRPGRNAGRHLCLWCRRGAHRGAWRPRGAASRRAG